MRFYSYAIALLGIFATVECLPKAVRENSKDEKYLDLVREIADFAEIENDPSHIETKNSQSNPKKSLIEVARDVAGEFVKERRAEKQESEKAGIGSAAEAMRSFNRPSPGIRKLMEQQTKEKAELETILLMVAGEKKELLREIDVDLTARRAVADPSCNITIDCSSSEKRTYVDGKEFRNIDGICNNLINYTYGMTYAQHRRLLPDTYGDGRWDLRTTSVLSTNRRNIVPLPSARNISNVVHNGTSEFKPDNDDDISMALFYFMQFIDHDLAKTPEGEKGANQVCCDEDVDSPRGFCMPIKVDVEEDYFALGQCLDARRSFTLFRCNDETGFQNQINEITSFLDGSMVYGSTIEEQATLRTRIGGWLKESSARFLPNSSHASQLPCNMSDPNYNYCFETGDTRANVHSGLTSYHVMFVRLHNNIVKLLAENNSSWSDERLYQESRKIVGAVLQRIVYDEMVPILFPAEELALYGVSLDYSYDDTIDPSMTQAFSMAYRYHHLMPHKLYFAAEDSVDNTVANTGSENQEDVFLRPHYLTKDHYNGIDHIALGLAENKCPYVDRIMNGASRNKLFLDNTGSSFDLAALNNMRAREWGMATYVSYRAFCGLGNATTWSDLLNTTNQEDIDKMATVYPDVRDIDPWTGIVAERKLAGSISGPTQTCLVSKHLRNIKHGDRFWYEHPTNGFDTNQLQQIESKTLARVMCDTLKVNTMRTEVFRTNSAWTSCDTIRSNTGGDWNFSHWLDV